MKKTFLILSITIFSAFAMEQDQPVILVAPYSIVLEPSIEGSWLGKVLPKQLSPQKFQDDLVSWIRKNTSDPAFMNRRGQLPTLMQEWLLDQKTCAEMKKIVQDKVSYFNPIYHVAGAAFDPEETAKHLVKITGIVSLLQASKGVKYLATNWNTESLEAIKNKHSFLSELFTKHYISAQRGYLTSEKVFFSNIVDEAGSGKPYYYIDIQDGTDSFEAAEEAGITTIHIPLVSGEKKAAKLKEQLVQYKLIDDTTPA